MEEANIRLLEKSETDALTRLANRFRLNDYLDQVFEKALSEQTPLAMEILDIDYFKQYNDNYGHQAGDECIKRIAKQLELMQNDMIFCARYGGDEFIILYQNMTEKRSDMRRRDCGSGSLILESNMHILRQCLS